MATVTLTGSDADNLCYLGAEANASTIVSNPELAATEFSSANYASGSVDEGDYAKVTASAGTSMKYANVAHRFTFDLTSYNTGGYMVTGIKIYYDGYRSNGLTVHKVQHKSGSNWFDDSTIIPDTSDGAGWEYEGSTLTDVDNIIIDDTFEFGVITAEMYIESAITVDLYTDAAQIEVTYVSVASEGIFKVAPGTWSQDRPDEEFKLLPRFMSYTCKMGSYDFDETAYSGEFRISFTLDDGLVINVKPKLSSLTEGKFIILPRIRSLEDGQIKVLPKLDSMGEEEFKVFPKLAFHNPSLFKTLGRNIGITSKLINITPSFVPKNDTIAKALPRFTSHTIRNVLVTMHFSSTDYSAEFKIEDYPADYEFQYKVYPAVFASGDQFVRMYARFVRNFQLFRVVPKWTGPIRDPILSIMLLLKNNWNLTGSGVSTSDLVFSTGWYDNNIVLPQITVTPAYSRRTLQETGDKPIYKFEDTSFVNIWVRPNSDSAKSLGWAKHAEYLIREEVERILRTGSHIGLQEHNQEFAFAGSWRRLDETDVKPVILRSLLEIRNNFFRHSEEEA